MKAIKISYSRGYSIAPYLQEKPGIEAELEEGEDPIAALQELKAMTEKFHKTTNPGLYLENMETGEITIGSPISSVDTRLEALISDINSCISIDEKNKYGQQIGLIAYEQLSTQHPSAKTAYDKRLKELQG